MESRLILAITPFFFFNPHLRTFFSLPLEREKGREWEKHWCGREASVGCLLSVLRLGIDHMRPDQGTNPQPSHVPWPGIEPTTLWLWNDTPTNWATLARAALTPLFSLLPASGTLLPCYLHAFSFYSGLCSGVVSSESPALTHLANVVQLHRWFCFTAFTTTWHCAVWLFVLSDSSGIVNSGKQGLGFICCPKPWNPWHMEVIQ